MSKSFVVYRTEGADFSHEESTNIPVLHTEDYELANLTVEAYWLLDEYNYSICERSDFKVTGVI